MTKRGRHRKATYDLEKLMKYDREKITAWVRDMMGPLNYDLGVLIMIEKWLNGKEYSKYKKIRNAVTKRLKEYEEPINGRSNNTTPGLVTDEEKRIIKWFLDRKWDKAKEYDDWENYLYSMGWLYFNAMVISDINPLQEAFRSLETIKAKDTQTFQNYLNTCMSAYNDEMKKIKPTDNLVAFPKVTAGQ